MRQTSRGRGPLVNQSPSLKGERKSFIGKERKEKRQRQTSYSNHKHSEKEGRIFFRLFEHRGSEQKNRSFLQEGEKGNNPVLSLDW